jgi:hypothetical protein
VGFSITADKGNLLQECSHMAPYSKILYHWNVGKNNRF